MLSLAEVIAEFTNGRPCYKGSSIVLYCNSQYPITQIPLHCMNRRFWAKKSWHHIDDKDELQNTSEVLSYVPIETDYKDIAGNFINQAIEFFGWLNGYELAPLSCEEHEFQTKLCDFGVYEPYTERNVRGNGDVEVLNVVCFYVTIEDLYNLCYSYTRCAQIDKILLDLEEEQDFVIS